MLRTAEAGSKIQADGGGEMIDRPSEKEQEYFVRQEVERLKALREEHRKRIAEQQRKELKDLHWMHCPKCGHEMTTTGLEGVEIDVCADCGGIFLDAGELDKIVEEKRRSRFANTLAFARRLWSS